MRPAAAWMFCCSMAFFTSKIESPRPLRRTGLSHTRIAYCRFEHSTSATPSMRCTESAISFSTKLPRSVRLISLPSVMNTYIAMRSSGRFFTVMPFCTTSVGSFGSARLTAFCRFTRLMLGSVPVLKVT